MFSMFTARPTHRPASLVLASAATLSAFALLLSAAPTANAQANLLFTGGNGTPLTLTVTSPVTYTLNANASQLLFVFDAVGGASFVNTASGSLTYTINGGSPQTFSIFRNGVSGDGGLTTDDVVIYGPAVPASASNTVMLTGGTLTLSGNYAAAPPTSGAYTTFISSNSGIRVSPNGVSGAAAAPEPSTLPLLGMGLTMGAGMVGTVRRRKQSKQAA